MSSKKSISFSEKVFSYLSKLSSGDIILPKPHVVYIKLTDSPEEVMKRFVLSKYSRLLVYSDEEDKFVGYIYFKEFFYNYLKFGYGFEISKIVKDILVVPENMNLSKVFVAMQERFSNICVVMDEYGNHIGILTIEDIIEKVFGEIVDESDELGDKEEDIVKISEDEYLISAWLTVERLSEITGIYIPEGIDVRTVNGFLMFLSGSIPKYQNVLEYGGWEFRVAEIENNRISKVLIKKV